MATYEFGAFTEQELLDQGMAGSDIGRGDVFVMPASTSTTFTVLDNDQYLSGDGTYWSDDNAADWSYQTATVTTNGLVTSSGRQIYAECYHWVWGSDGKWYLMIEVEIEGKSGDYFTFYGDTPPAGTVLRVDSGGDVTSDWVDFNCLMDPESIAPPKAVDDAIALGEQQTGNLNLLANDFDVDGDAFAITAVSGGVVGQAFEVTTAEGYKAMVTVHANGTATVVPGPGFIGMADGETATVSFTYTITDADGLSSTATVHITVNGETTLDAVDDAIVVTESEGAGDSDGNALANDRIDGAAYQGEVAEVNGDAADVGTWVTGSNGGRMLVKADGSFDFDAAGDFESLAEGETAQTSFTYQISETGEIVKDHNILFVFDISNSTVALDGDDAFVGAGVGDVNHDGRADTVLDAQIAAAKAVVQDLLSKGIDPAKVKVGIVTFSGINGEAAAYNNAYVNAATVGTYQLDAANLLGAFDGIKSGGWTNYEAGLKQAESWFDHNAQAGQENVMYFLSDGRPVTGYDSNGNQIEQSLANYGDELSRIESKFDASVHAIAVGENADTGKLDQIDNTGGAVRVMDAASLTSALLASHEYVVAADTATITVTVQGETDVVAVADHITVMESETAGDAETLDGGASSVLENDRQDGADSGLAFEMEATVRFDDLAGGHWQRVFDFGNGPAQDNILLSQIGNSDDMRFEVYKGGISYGIDACDVIVQGETADWRATISDSGWMQLFKNGVLVAEGQGTVPADVERAYQLVGESNWSADTPLKGEVSAFEINETGGLHEGAAYDGAVLAVNGDAGLVAQFVEGSNGGLLKINADGTVDFDADGDFAYLREGESAETTFTYSIENGETATVTVTVKGELTLEAADDAISVMESEGAGDADGNALSNDRIDGAAFDGVVEAVNGAAANVGTWVAGSNGGRMLVRADGSFDFDANGEFDGLDDGESAQTSFTYQISESGEIVKDHNILFVFDISNSTVAIDGGDAFDGESVGDVNGDGRANTVLDAQIVAAKAVVADLMSRGIDPAKVNIGIVTFSGINGEAAAYNDALVNAATVGTFRLDDAGLMGAFDGILSGGWTNYEAGLKQAQDWFAENAAAGEENVMYFLSDGRPISGVDAEGNYVEQSLADYGDELGAIADGFGTAIHAVGVGSNITRSTLDAIDTTGGATIALDASALTAALLASHDYVRAVDTATITVTVNGETVVVARDDAMTVSEDETAGDADLLDTGATSVTANDGKDGGAYDGAVEAVNGASASVGAAVAGSNGGLLTINADGSVDFDANGEFDGLQDGESAVTTFTYAIDGGETATVTVTVTGETDFFAVGDVLTVTEDEGAGLNLLDDGAASVTANDYSDAGAYEGEVLGVGGGTVGAPVAGSNGGLLTVNADGTFDFDANGEFEALKDGQVAQTTFEYAIEDGKTATVTVNVTGINDYEAVADVMTVSESESAGDMDALDSGAASALANDIEDTVAYGGHVLSVNGDASAVSTMGSKPSVTYVQGSDGGLLAVYADGTMDFDANGDFEDLKEGETGQTTFTYEIEGGETTTITVNVRGETDWYAFDDAMTVTESEGAGDADLLDGGAASILANDLTDDGAYDGSVLAAGGEAPGAWIAGSNGGLALINADGTLDFDANGEFEALKAGETAQTTFTYGIEGGKTATITVTVEGETNYVAIADVIEVMESEAAGDLDAMANGAASVLANDTADEAAYLGAVEAVNGDAGNVAQVVAGSNGGLLTIYADGTTDFDANGEFEALKEGETAETGFTYTIADGKTATVMVIVNGETDYAAVADTMTVTEEEAAGDADLLDSGAASVLANDIKDDGSYDGAVLAVNGAAAAVAAAVSGTNGGLLTVNADGSVDFDADGDFDALADGESAQTSFSYEIEDGKTATITVTVQGITDYYAEADLMAVWADEGFGDADLLSDGAASVLANDWSDEGAYAGSVLAVNDAAGNTGEAVAGTNGGLLVINADGTLDFSANGEFGDLLDGQTALTQFTYAIEDGKTASVTVQVQGQTVRAANDDALTVMESEGAGDADLLDSGEASVLANDTQNGGAYTSVVGSVNGYLSNVNSFVAGSNGGLLKVNANGTLDFDANGDFDLVEGETAETSFTYTLVSGEAATVTVTVVGEAEYAAIDDVISVMSDETAGDVETLDGGAASLLANDAKDGAAYAGDVLSVGGDADMVGQVVAGSNGGYATIYADGSVDFDAADEFSYLAEGEIVATTFTYGIAGGAEATLTVNVEGISQGDTTGGGDDGTGGGDGGSDPASTINLAVVLSNYQTMYVEAATTFFGFDAFADWNGNGVVNEAADIAYLMVYDFLEEAFDMAAAAGKTLNLALVSFNEGSGEGEQWITVVTEGNAQAALDAHLAANDSPAYSTAFANTSAWFGDVSQAGSTNAVFVVGNGLQTDNWETEYAAMMAEHAPIVESYLPDLDLAGIDYAALSSIDTVDGAADQIFIEDAALAELYGLPGATTALDLDNML